MTGVCEVGPVSQVSKLWSTTASPQNSTQFGIGVCAWMGKESAAPSSEVPLAYVAVAVTFTPMGHAAVSTTPSAWLATYLKNFELRGPACEPQEVGSEGVPPGQSASVVQGLPAFGPSTQMFIGQPAPAQSSGVIPPVGVTLWQDASAPAMPQAVGPLSGHGVSAGWLMQSAPPEYAHCPPPTKSSSDW